MSPGPPGPVGLPVGTGIELDPTVRQIGADVLVGGAPRRVLRLSPGGVAALAELRDGEVRTPAGAKLARRLTDAGLAHPVTSAGLWAIAHDPADVTVLVPAFGRAGALDRCLRALGGAHPVLVVDDGSSDRAALADVAARHGARLVRREVNGGPAAARNRGLELITTEFVAFLDSDCVPPPGWIDALTGHLADPLVAAVAPRIAPAPPPSTRTGISCVPGEYARVRGALDLGPRRARVAPGTGVPYVPTAALLARTSSLRAVARGGAVFDEGLRYGEDVDLIWRLDAAGWRVRYDPDVRVGHVEPAAWAALLARRFRYGTSAAGLSSRHPGALAPLILEPYSAAAVGALLAGRPRLAVAALAGGVHAERKVRRAAGVPDGAAGLPHGSVVAVLDRAVKTGRAAGSYATQFLAPALLAGLIRRRTRFAALALLAAAPAATWWARPTCDIAPFAAAHVAEDVAYGAGVIAGSVRARSTRALRPVRSRRMSGRAPGR